MRYWDRVRQIQARLGNRKLVYFGTRGTDARPLLSLDLLDAVFCQIAPLQVPGIEEVCLETLKGVRVDLNRYNIDKDDSPEVDELRDRMLRRFGRPAAVIPYRPAAILTSTWFPRADRVTYLGVFHEKQACFEHKPWVENQLDARGIPIVPWTYYADADRILIKEALRAGPLVLRANRSDGGAGLGILHDPDELDQHWPEHKDGFLAASPLLRPSLPLNVNACVFRGGDVVIHPPSIQLIGIPECTTRPLGYCGNDFVRIADLEAKVLNELEAIIRNAGKWLASEGYLGAFGVDGLFYKGRVYLVEINPRFQGSSVLAASIMRGMDLPDLFLDHIAALIGLDAGEPLSLMDLVKAQAKNRISHVLVYSRQCGKLAGVVPEYEHDCGLSPDPGVELEKEAILFSLVFKGSVTSRGTLLYREVSERIRGIIAKLPVVDQ